MQCLISVRYAFLKLPARGVFYTDAGHSFDSVLLYGNELQLFQAELMVFVLAHSVCGDGALAMLAVIAFHLCVRLMFGWLWKRNLCRQTLIEPRFLQ